MASAGARLPATRARVMESPTVPRLLLAQLASVLDYPAQGAAPLRACAAALPAYPAAAARLARLATRGDAEGTGALEESYVAAFELAPVASPFVGDQLFGAAPARHLFLVKVKELQEQAGLDPSPELPDHLASVLRYLAVAPPSEARDDLLRDGALPAARRMLAALDGAGNPWGDALSAVVEVLEALERTLPAAAPAPLAAEASS